MKKTLIAALASLMLAGALCAVDGANERTSTGAYILIGDGGEPIVASSHAEVMNSDFFSHSNQF